MTLTNVPRPSFTVEMSFTDEQEARDTRRWHINGGRGVSLLSFDPARNLYVFDITH